MKIEFFIASFLAVVLGLVFFRQSTSPTRVVNNAIDLKIGDRFLVDGSTEIYVVSSYAPLGGIYAYDSSSNYLHFVAGTKVHLLFS